MRRQIKTLLVFLCIAVLVHASAITTEGGTVIYCSTSEGAYAIPSSAAGSGYTPWNGSTCSAVGGVDDATSGYEWATVQGTCSGIALCTITTEGVICTVPGPPTYPNATVESIWGVYYGGEPCSVELVEFAYAKGQSTWNNVYAWLATGSAGIELQEYGYCNGTSSPEQNIETTC